MKITSHNDRRVVVTYTQKSLLLSIVGVAVFTLISVLLDAKHPIFWINCTRHSSESVDGEDIDCSMTVRPERRLLDMRLHEEFHYSFELRSVELTTRGECKASPEASNLRHHTHIQDKPHERCHYVINLIDDKGKTHPIRHLETSHEASRVYRKLNEFIQKTQSTAHSVSLAIHHDTSFSDESAFCVGLVLLLWLLTRALHEKTTIDRDSGVLVRVRTNALQCVCSEAVVSLENVVGAEVRTEDVFFVTPGSRQENATRHSMKEYELRVNINSGAQLSTVPRNQSRASWCGRCAALWGWASRQGNLHHDGAAFLELGLGARFADDANLKRVVEAITTVLLAYGRTAVHDVKLDAKSAVGEESNIEFSSAICEDTQCIVCYSRTARILLLPCRHVPCCGPCSDRLTTCPLCRTQITSRITALI